MEEFANDRNALTCFKATGAAAWPLWASLASAKSQTRQFLPAQVAAVVKRLPFAQNHMS